MPDVDAERAEQARIEAEHAAADAQRAADEAAEDAEADKAFDSGYTGEKTPDDDRVPTTLPTEGAPVVTDEPKPDDKTKVETPAVTSPPVLTKEQVEQILSVVTLVPELRSSMEKQFGTAFGKMGGLERTLKAFQDNATATGEPITVSKEDLKEIVEEFPDLSEKLVPVLSRVVSKIKIPKASPVATFDPSEVSKVVDKRIEEFAPVLRKQQAIADLSETHPDWAEVVGAPGSKAFGTETPWKAWLKKQPADYQQRVSNSWNATIVGNSIDRFHADAERDRKANEAATKKAAETSAASSRKQRLQEAVAAKKPSAAQETTKSDDEMFDEGFKSGRT